MRLPALAFAVMVCATTSLSAQTYWLGDTLSPRLHVSSCQLADSVLGAAAKGVLKSESHGVIKSSSEYSINSGPVRYRDRLPASLELFSGAPGTNPIPPGVLDMWFYGSILNAERDPSKPFTVVVDDSLAFPLGMPKVPIIRGPTPDVIFFNVIVESDVVTAMLHGKKVRVDFLGKKQEINHDRLEEFEGATRLAICAHAGQLASK